MVKQLSGGIANSGLYRHYIVIGNTLSSYDYDCICDGSATFQSPQYSYEEITVPGRNGKLYYDNGRYENVTIKYTMFFTDMTEYRDFVNKLLSLRGYQRLDDSHHPNEYRLALLVSSLEPEVSGYDNEYCSLELEFTAKPERYLYSGEQEQILTNNGTIYNATYNSAKPLLMVKCSSSTTSFKLNGYQVTIYNGNAYDYVYIDCETEDAYHGDTNLNGRLVCENFPKLSPGTNILTNASGLTHIKMIPRWWEL